MVADSAGSGEGVCSVPAEVGGLDIGQLHHPSLRKPFQQGKRPRWTAAFFGYEVSGEIYLTPLIIATKSRSCEVAPNMFEGIVGWNVGVELCGHTSGFGRALLDQVFPHLGVAAVSD